MSLAGKIPHFSHCTKPQDNQCSLNTQNKGPAWLPGHSWHHLPQGWGCSKNQNWYRKLLHFCLFPMHCSLGPRDEGIPRENEVQQGHSVQQHSTERKVRKNMKKKSLLDFSRAARAPMAALGKEERWRNNVNFFNNFCNLHLHSLLGQASQMV